MYAVVLVGWAAAAVRHTIKLCYYVTNAAGKVAVNWIQLCYNLWPRRAHFSPISRDGNFRMRIVSYKSRENSTIISHTSNALVWCFSCFISFYICSCWLTSCNFFWFSVYTTVKVYLRSAVECSRNMFYQWNILFYKLYICYIGRFIQFVFGMRKVLQRFSQHCNKI